MPQLTVGCYWLSSGYLVSHLSELHKITEPPAKYVSQDSLQKNLFEKLLNIHPMTFFCLTATIYQKKGSNQ